MTENTLSCDVIIVNYNGKEKVLGCLHSVFSHLPPGCKVWLVDNASTDGSVEAIEKDFPQTNLIRSKINNGFGAGSNLGARQGKQDYVAFLNPDTQVEPGWLESLVAPLRNDAKVGLSTAKILFMHQPDHINACGNSVHFTGLTLCRGLGFKKDEFNRFEQVSAVSGAAFAVRRELFEKLGGFDEDMFLYMEDSDLSWRVWLSGNSCVFTPDSIVLHDYALRIDPQKIFLQERNRYLMLLKNLKWQTLLLLLPAQILAEFITWGFVLLRQRNSFKYKWKAYQWIWTHWNIILEKRKRDQSSRRIRDRELLKHTSYKITFEQVEQGNLAFIARFMFNPIFFLLHRVSMAVAWW